MTFNRIGRNVNPRSCKRFQLYLNPRNAWCLSLVSAFLLVSVFPFLLFVVCDCVSGITSSSAPKKNLSVLGFL
ncbi:hypothetical protein HanOQP8_Chr15g0591841 [Helianthus annuus]|nr:hypothetical protein HanHA89_Chr15g0634391 [Helianthus annuus]KAJ0650401.1 hypothetical protein HanLR1_Chr15g0595311 [Helianthus annuus]KAJ0654165.1 hypothetical protein HanOQP8_Chr15g0591841 [Helianthus annuus]